jgi:hypothetical protein
MLGRINNSQVAANTRPTDENRVLIGFFMASAFLVRLFLLCAVVVAMRYRGATPSLQRHCDLMIDALAMLY